MVFVHVHLVFNHLVLYAVFFYVLLRAYYEYRGKEIGGWVALVVQLIWVGLLVLLSYSGHQSEELLASRLEDSEGFWMDRHEEWGEWAVRLGAVNALTHAVAVRYPAVKRFTWVSLMMLLGFVVLTCYYGGRLAHPEIR